MFYILLELPNQLFGVDADHHLIAQSFFMSFFLNQIALVFSVTFDWS